MKNRQILLLKGWWSIQRKFANPFEKLFDDNNKKSFFFNLMRFVAESDLIVIQSGNKPYFTNIS